MVKGAIEAYSRAVAVHCGLAKNGVRCNTIHPSGIATPMVASVPALMEEKFGPSPVQEAPVIGVSTKPGDKELIFNTLRQYAHCMIVQDLKEALIEAVKFSKDDDCVLFSPACSSLDMFKDYKDRGETFKRLIKDLDNE